MVAETDEYNCLVTRNDPVSIKVKVFDIKNSTEEKFIGVKFDKKLKFESHMSFIFL